MSKIETLRVQDYLGHIIEVSVSVGTTDAANFPKPSNGRSRGNEDQSRVNEKGAMQCGATKGMGSANCASSVRIPNPKWF
jgi:hypothetical protein